MEWHEIFKTGTHTDNAGRKKQWTEGDLLNIFSKYNPAEHEAPIVIGHPVNNAPAYGWVEALKVSDGKLFAKFKQVADNFKEWVNQGRYKKKSIAIYPDGTLRHVGFLGAVPPAIKGIADSQFNQGDFKYYEYQEEQNNMELEKQLAEEKAAREKAESTAKEALQKLEELSSAFAESQAKQKKKEIDQLIEAGIKEGKMLPDWKTQGLGEFMMSLETGTTTYEFSEGKKMTQGEWFRNFLATFAAHPLFTEMANKVNAKNDKDDKDHYEPGLTAKI
jgi:hypothetical protein